MSEYGQLYDPPIDIGDLKAKFKTAKEVLDSKHFPKELLQEFSEYLEWVTENGGPQNTVYLVPEVKKFFFEEFVGGIAKRLSLIKELPDADLPLISKLVLSIAEIFRLEIDNDNSDMADAMRYLFDSQCLLHQNLFLSEESSILKVSYEPSLAQCLPPEEVQWRKALHNGSKIDVIKRDQSSTLKLWSKATVINIEGDLVQVYYDNDSRNTSTFFWWYSPDIDQYNTKSNGDEWRMEIKPGDVVDTNDTTKIWYASTVLDRIIRQEEDGNEFILLKIGFRIYHPDGNKKDNNNKPFFGWSESFDEFIPASSPRVQRFQTFAKSFEDSKSNLGMQLDETLDDQLDMLLYSKNPANPVYALIRQKCKSGLLVTLLNNLGRQGVFKRIIERISMPSLEALSLETVFYYIDCVTKSSLLFNRSFVNDFFPALYQAAKQKFLSASEASLRNLKRDRLDSLISSIFGGFLSRIMPQQPREHEKNMFMLDLGIYFLTLNFLEKRIDGAKMIQEVCKTANMTNFSSSVDTMQNTSEKQNNIGFIQQIIKKTQEGKVLYQMFSKERGHHQMVERSEEIIKLLISQDSLNIEELELIWSSTKLDETTQHEVYNLFNELASRLKLPQISFIIDQLSQVPLHKLMQDQVALVYEIAKRARTEQTLYGPKAVEYLWKIAVPNPNESVDKILVNQAALAIPDVIKTWDNNVKLSYIKRLVDSLNQNQEGFLCVKMLGRLFRDFYPQQQYENEDQMETDQKPDPRFENRSTFIEHVEDDMQLMNAFFLNFKSYMLKARLGLRSKQQSEPLHDTKALADKVLADRFIHSDQMNERFDFIKYVASNSAVKATKFHISVLWNELVVHQMFQEDSDHFYKFLTEVCELYGQGFRVVELEDLLGFFQEQVFASKEDEQLHSRTTIEGFNCIQSFFILMNQYNKKLVRLLPMTFNTESTVQQYPPAKKMTSYSSQTGGNYQNYSFTNKSSNKDDEDYGFQILVPPWDLNGLDTIWKIIIEAKDARVENKATAFLIQLYTCVDFSLQDRVPEFEDAYIEFCIKSINFYKDLIQNRTEIPKEEYQKVEKPITKFSTITSSVTQRVQPFEESRIIKFLNLIKELIKNSEIEGTRGVKSHTSLFRGAFLDCLQITNSYKQANKYQKRLELGVYSNITIFDLRKLIGEHISRVYQADGTYVQEKPCHPYSIRIYRYSGCVDIPESDNGKTLSEMRFKRNEQLTVYKRSIVQSGRMPLLNQEGDDICGRLKFILNDLFDKFSSPTESGLRVMDKSNLRGFISLCTDDDTKEEDPQLLQIFEKYSNNEVIQRENFITFWRNSVIDSEMVVWQNLFNFGLRYDLQYQAVDGSDDHLNQVRNTKEQMPRFKLSTNEHYFNSLFSLLSTLNTDASQPAWSLIKGISTQPSLYQRVLTLEDSLSSIFDSSALNLHMMLYLLQLVESLLEDSAYLYEQQQQHSIDQQHEIDQQQQTHLKLTWLSRFMSLGGFQHILNMFHKSLELIATTKQADSMSKFEKNFIEQMLKLIRIFVLAAYAIDEGEGDEDGQIFEVIEMVRSKSKNNEGGEEANKEEGKQGEATQEFKTPNKQVKGGFVQRFKEKRVQFGTSDEITEELLFGEGSSTAAPLDQKEAASIQDQQNPATQQQQQQQQQRDETKKRFQTLAKIMRESGQGGQILQKIDFADLQTQVLEVICLILGKKELGVDDNLIIEHALGLWVATLVKNPQLINQFYQYRRPGVISSFAIKNVEEFIANGIFTYKSLKVREEFGQSILCICQKVKNPSGMQPLMFFLNVLRNNYPREDLYYVWRECRLYFDLFISLLEEYFKQSNQEEDDDQKVDIYEILSETIDKMKQHDCKEKKGSILEDKTLIGYFNMIERLIKMIKLKYLSAARLNEVITESNLIEELFQDYLFYNTKEAGGDNNCKTKESRTAAYSLLQVLVETLQPHQMADFLEEKVWNIIKDLPRPKKWQYIPSDNSKSTMQSQFVGLVNLGCICYMNSMMQQFFMVPQFRYQLLRAVDESAPNLKEYKGYYIEDNLLRQLQIMFGNLELSERQAFYPLGFCFAFKDFDGNPTNTAIQQDAQEFLNIFFARLEEMLKPTTQKHLLDSVFGGKVCSQIKCPACGNIRNILETFYTLTVQVKDRRGLLDSLQKMIESSIINDFRCENCKQKVDVEKRQLIAETPNVLIVHLQRIIFNFDTFQNDKINSHFDFPTVLNLKDYSFKTVMTAEGHPKPAEDSNVRHLLDIEDDDYVYKLVGVTIHRGTAEHGHYYSLINTKRGKEELEETKPEWFQTEKETWKVFDDENVKYFNFSDLKEEAFGGNTSQGGNGIVDTDLQAYYMQSGTANSYGQNAYMLVYEKMKKKPLREVVIPPKAQTSDQDTDMKEDGVPLECIDTATSRVSASHHLQPTISLPHLSQSPSEVEHVDPANGEIYKLVTYRKVEPYVPNWIKGQVLEDNTVFLIDRYIYNESFFNFLKSLLKHLANNLLMSQHQYQFEYLPHFHRLKTIALRVTGKVMFDMLAYYYYNTQMSDITSSLQTILTFSDSLYTLQKGDSSIILEFLKCAYLEDGCQHFFNIMFQCSDKTARFYIGRLTSLVLNKIYSLYKDSLDQEIPESLQELKDIADGLLLKFVNTLKTPECMKNWQKIDQYLKMIQDIAIGGILQQDLLLTRFEIVAYLLEFLMANVSQKTSSKMSTFQPIVSLICMFVRFSFTPPMRQEYQQWADYDEEGINPPATLLGFEPKTMRYLPEKYPLKDEHLDFILESDFVELSLKEGVETEQLGKMIAHLCFKYEKFSRRISKLLLHGISRNDYEKVRNYLDVVTQIALVRDQFQRSRLEWMFGFGSLISHVQNDRVSSDPNEIAIKVGTKVLHSLSDEAYAFKSSLIQDSHDDSLLHLLWRYRGRMDTYTVNCLYSLLNLIAQDDNVASYFANLPAPTYCHSRYTDWIYPYLEKQLIDARKGYAGTFSSEKEEVVIKCQSLYEKYDAFLKRQKSQAEPFKISFRPHPEFDKDEEEKKHLISMQDDENEDENIRNLISETSLQRWESDGVVAQYLQQPESSEVLKCDPQPYIITDCLSERIVYANDFGNVLLEISALGCFYTTSLPTGDTNLAIPQGLFKKGNTSAASGVNKPTSHEQKLQAQFIDGYFRSAGTLAGKQRRGGMLIKAQQEEEQMQEEEEDLYSAAPQNKKIIKDGDDQWQMVNNNEINNDIAQDIDQIQNMSFESSPDDKEEEEPVYRIKVIEEGEEQVVGGGDTFITAQEGPPSANANGEEIKQDEEEPIQIQWPQEVKYCDDLVYRIQVINYRDVPIKCTIKFRIEEGIAQEDVNLFFPVGGFKATVQAKDTKTILLLHKLKAELNLEDEDNNEINKLVTEFYFKQKLMMNGKSAVPSTGGSSVPPGYQPLRNRNLAQVHPMVQEDHNDKNADVKINLNDSNIANVSNEDSHDSKDQWQDHLFDNSNAVIVPSKDEAAQQTESKAPNDMNIDSQYINEKQCPQCTVFNDLKNAFCEVCYYNF